MTKIFRDLTRKFVGLNIKKSVLTTKMRVLTIKNRYLTMKLELVLTMKIVDDFVRFGMPYPSPVLLYAKMEGEDLGERFTCMTSGRHEGT